MKDRTVRVELSPAQARALNDASTYMEALTDGELAELNVSRRTLVRAGSALGVAMHRAGVKP